MKKIVVLILGALLFLSAKPALAVQFKTGSDISFSKDQKIDETIFLSGNNINFDGSLNGDLFCAGQNITITGNVKGDVLCAGQTIKITGNVDGDVRLASQSINIEGTVSRNVDVLTQQLTFGPKSNIKGDIIFGAQVIDLNGIAGRDLTGAGQNIVVTGSLLRNAVVIVNNMQVTGAAKVGGNIDYFVDPKDTASLVNVDPKSVKGTVTKHELVKPNVPDVRQEVETKINAVKPSLEIFGKIMGIISFTLLTFVLIYFSRPHTNKVLSIIKEKPVVSGLIGLAVLIVAPIALFILCATIVGMPIALVIFLLYMITLFVSSLYPTLWVGMTLTEKMYKGKPYSIYLAAFVGCLIVGLLTILPILGMLLIMLLFLVGLGASFLSYLPER
ncbi:MAG TPA: polymer-forming cytoskeletal protein [Patescibacteria group bacterium]